MSSIRILCSQQFCDRVPTIRFSHFLSLLIVLLSPFVASISQTAYAQDSQPKAQDLKLKVGYQGRGGSEVFLSKDLKKSAVQKGWKLAAFYGGIELSANLNETNRLTLLAERAVFWSPGEAKLIGQDFVRAVYAEGHVFLLVEEDNKVVTRVESERIFIDLASGHIVLMQARMRVPTSSKKKNPRRQTPLDNRPLIIGAKRLSIYGAIDLLGDDITVTTSVMQDPTLAVKASRLKVELAEAPYPSAVTAMGGAAAPIDTSAQSSVLNELLVERKSSQSKTETEQSPQSSDLLQEFRDEPRYLILEDAALEARGIPFAYVPKLTWKSTWDLFPRIRYGNSTLFGNFVSADLNIPMTEAKRVVIDGDKVRDGLTSSLQLGVANSSRRGPSVSAGLKWKYYNKSKRAISRGRIRSSYLEDKGQDLSGLMLRRESRGWFAFAEQTEVAKGWRVDAEVSHLSDRGYLLEFEERIAKTDKQQETYLYTHYRKSNWYFAGLGRFRINDFQTYVERLPELTIDMFSQPLFENPGIGGQATVSWDMTFSHLRLRPDNLLRNQRSRRANRIDTSFEIDEKIPLGPIISRGFFRQRFTAVDNAVNRRGGLERHASEVGINLATNLYRHFDHSFTHVLVPEIGYFNRFDNSRGPEEFFQFDEVDALRATEFFYARARTRFSVRQDPDFDDPEKDHGAREVLNYYDLLDFVIESRYFPKAGKDNDGRNFGSLFTDFRFFLPGLLRARNRIESDPSRGQVITNESFIDLFPTDNLVVSASYRDLRNVTRALGWSITWNLSRKWSLRLEEQFDFLTNKFTTHRGIFRRRFEQFAVDMVLSVDPGEDDVSFSIQIAPDIFNARQDPFRQGRLSGISY